MCCNLLQQEEEVDILGDSSGGEEEEKYEEYTWAGQTRVRTTTMIQGGLAGWALTHNFGNSF